MYLNQLSIKGFLLVLICCISSKSFSQLSNTHFIPPLTNSAFGNANAENQYIYISTPSTTNVAYTIIPIGETPANYITGVVSNATPQEIFVDNDDDGQLFIPSNQTSRVVANRGYIIEAEKAIYVSVRMDAGAGDQAGALVSKGLSALGTTFRVGSFTNQGNPGIYDLLNFVSVMATEDNTQISFEVKVGLTIENYTGLTPINISLNRGESYTIATSDDTINNRDGLIGTLINSNKPIVVNCGSTNGSFHNTGGRDYGIDQIVGLDKVGTEYIFVKGDGEDEWENILLVPHTPGTTYSINGGAPLPLIFPYVLIEGNQYNANENMYVQTSEPVFAYQGIGATNSEANQGLFFVPPLSCETRGNLDNIADIASIGNITYTGGVTIVTRIGATVTVNNLPLSNFATEGPNAVTGNPNYITYKILGLSGNISIQCDDELYASYFNFNGNASSGSFYSGFPSPPEINLDEASPVLGTCIPNVILEVANPTRFDSFEWLYDDGLGNDADGNGSPFDTTGSNSLQYTPTQAGVYKLIGILNCTGNTLESTEVVVSNCSDDSDNDGIPDNIDIDNDNDGMLNCLESYGNQDINLTNPTTMGTIPVGGYTYLGAVNTIGTAAVAPFVGLADGTFMSETPSRNGATETSVSYNLTFNNSLNILLEYGVSTLLGSGLLTDDEEFIVRVENTRTITLLDPDNQLLVDSNFDGVYEAGITQISAFEIRFKLNSPSLASGAGTFSFHANAINEITYIHKNLSEAATNQATFRLTATCVPFDSDGDGIQDSKDLDSDNDGVPDFIENNGTFTLLLGVDADLNGLDDSYNINGIIPIDTDGDNVPDVYDLDSDNDGIYDIVETEQLGILFSDTNLDGIEDSPNFGANGWVDTAETTPDSNAIGYILSDTDTDLIYNYLDPDSDNDGCNDVIEAGFSDANGNDYLGDIAPTTNVQGKVNNAADGYTIPNGDYLIFAPITIETQPIDVEVCETTDNNLTLASSSFDTIQWEFSTDGINWTNVIDNATYNGSQTNSLLVTNTPIALDGNLYRALLNRNGNACGLYSDIMTLTVNPLPVVNTPVELVQCDDDDLATLGFSTFNLTEANSEISANAANETFSYYLTRAAALIGNNTSADYINNPNIHENRMINTDVVWARVETASGCTTVAEIQLLVSTIVIPSTVLEVFYQCDDFLDINGNNNANNDNRDGIAEFDFSNASAVILANIPPGQNPSAPRYFRNEADALAEANEIIDIVNYRNIGYPGSQTIYVRVDSQILNDCLALGPHVLLNVETLPVANPVGTIRACDDDGDGEYPFDTSQIEAEILGTQNPADVFIEYFDETGMPLTPLPDPFLTGNQTITVLVTNVNTNAPDGPCNDATTIQFIVDESPTANPVNLTFCDGNAGDNNEDNIYPFDTSSIEDSIIGTQTGVDVLYTYLDENGNMVNNAATLPNPLRSPTQTIAVQVINPLNTTCTASANIDLVVNPLPEFIIESPEIICTSDPSFTVVLDPIEADPLEIYTYEWLDENDNVLSNAEILSVSTPGTYTVILTTTDGTDCSRLREVTVIASEKATITQEDIIVVDASNNNTITINETNLGTGDYEYVLNDEFSSYQDEPFFDRLRGGIYTLYVRDKNGCGTTPIEFSIIDYPKFFTPNGDGINDNWQLYGVSSAFQPETEVFIFSQYGKLLKQISPLDSGWNGTYNGQLMPTSDYWFKINLQDGRQLKGHFTLKR